MRRGGRIAIDGRLEWREWETAEQQKRQAVSIVADTVQFLDGPKDQSDAGDEEEDDDGGGAEGREPVGAAAHTGDLVF
jgi:single-strand DNA-binding protein